MGEGVGRKPCFHELPALEKRGKRGKREALRCSQTAGSQLSAFVSLLRLCLCLEDFPNYQSGKPLPILQGSPQTSPPFRRFFSPKCRFPVSLLRAPVRNPRVRVVPGIRQLSANLSVSSDLVMSLSTGELLILHLQVPGNVTQCLKHGRCFINIY